ncbi:SseB family protein [Cellulomonas sp. Marseille-Q8402]
MGLFSRGGRASDPGTAGTPGTGVRNDRVRAGLATWAEQKDGRTFADVLRRCVTGELLLDVTGSTIADPAHGFQSGDTLAITSQTDDTGKRLLVAYTGHDELARHRGEPGASLVQPAAAVLAQAAREHEGIVVDGGAPGAFIAYAAEIHQQLTADPEAVARAAEATVSRALPFDAYLAVLADAPVFVPFEVRRDASGAETGVVVPAATGPDGQPYAVVGTAPAEIWAWSPRSGAQRTTWGHVVRAVAQDGQAGVVVNPAGPAVTVPAGAMAPRG